MENCTGDHPPSNKYKTKHKLLNFQKNVGLVNYGGQEHWQSSSNLINILDFSQNFTGFGICAIVPSKIKLSLEF